MTEPQVRELLEALTPAYDDRLGDWERVVAAADGARRHDRRRWIVRAGALATTVAAAAALVLAWPFQADQSSLLERARAAIGDGPVLHVVLRGEWGGTLVDIESGARSPVHGEREVWFDTERGLVREIQRLGDVVQRDAVSEPDEPPPELAALGRGYRRALEAGSARVGGEGTIDGEPVFWITIRSERLPDVSDGRDHEWAQQVAVSRRTHEPMALRETRDGEPGPGTTQRVLELELLPAGAGDFGTSSDRTPDRAMFRQAREPVDLDQARAVLGRAPFWLGREHRGLPLGRVFRETTSTGRQREIEVTGPDAAAALRCAKLRGKEGGECFRGLGLGSLSVRPDGVFRSDGPIAWSEEQTALALFYGTVADDPGTFRKDVVPRYDRPNVVVRQSTEPSWSRPGAGRFVPPPGALFVAAGARLGVLQLDGVHVAIEASGEDELLAAARALVPLAG